MRKEEIYLNVKKVSDNEFKNIISLLPKLDSQNFNSYDIQPNYYYLHVDYNGDWFVDKLENIIGKTEVNYKQFLTLFQPKLKIGDTFEHNGFICEVKEKIEEKNWYRIIDRIGNLYFEKMPKERAKQAVDYEVKSITEITNQEFIKQLEENAL